MLKKVSSKIDDLSKEVEKIEKIVDKANKIEDESKKAKYFSDKLAEQLNNARIPADELELLIPDELWQLPKYSEMLFIM